MNGTSTATRISQLAGAPAASWLAAAQQDVLRGDVAAAIRILETALKVYPAHADLTFALAGQMLQSGDHSRAQTLLRQLLQQTPGNAAAALLLARALSAHGRMQAAAHALRDAFDAAPQNMETRIQSVELLDDCRRQSDALALCEQAIDAGARDPRLYAYAGMLALQTGAFELARQCHESALASSDKAVEWHVPHGMASVTTYSAADHPDFARFRGFLQRTDLGDAARSSLLFALGKMHDDIGDHAAAAHYWHQANTLAHALAGWSRKQWRRSVQARLSAAPLAHKLAAPEDWVPVFIVGMPRSGTTLLAQLLARHDRVHHRGELDCLPELARQAALQPRLDHDALRRMADTYAAQARQDDAPQARWIIDKQPLNFRHVDLILALWPNARIIHCQRNARDTALSLWSQSFRSDVHGYASSFADIATVMRDCARLMKHARQRHGDAIRTVHYEQLVAAPEEQLAALGAWLGLTQTPADASPEPAAGTDALSTASLWQARQPVHARSVARWRAYAQHIPQLLQLPDE